MFCFCDCSEVNMIGSFLMLVGSIQFLTAYSSGGCALSVNNAGLGWKGLKYWKEGFENQLK